MLNKSKMEDCNHIITPMVFGFKLCKDDESQEVDQNLY